MARALRLSTAILIAAAVIPLAAQTPIKRPKNNFTPEQDVQLGREAAAEVLKKYPVIEDPAIAAYLDRLGKRLVAATPAEFTNPVFEYSFTPVNLKEINAFALPGGPMFVNRGMFEAAVGEGEVVGVMAHELSHVLLRHGTANATKAQGFQWGQLAGAITGAVVGGGWGQVIAQGSQFGLGTWLLKYSRDYEKQADLLGAQIMARAGYDPRDLGRMFETIAKQGGAGSPQWMSSHPDPGNRTQYIAKEAAMLQVAQRAPRGARLRAGEGHVRGAAGAAVDGGRRERRLGRVRRRRDDAKASAPSASPCPRPPRSFSRDRGRQAVRGGRAVELEGPLVEQRDRSRVRRTATARERTDRVHARRPVRRRPRLLSRSARGDARAGWAPSRRAIRSSSRRGSRRTRGSPSARRSACRSRTDRRWARRS